ncbi:unnamed protein product [Closterium sp. Naga37s-1]|nr:unnamed protein product [Closterium sp. Naga37s-1]
MAATASRGSSPFSRFGDSQSFNFDALKNFSALTPSIQSHLQKVYLTLALTLVVASLGAYAHVLWGLGGALSSIASIAGVLWLNATPAVPANESFRFRLLLAIAFSHGCSIGPLVDAVIQINLGLLVTAFVATAAIFLCFSGAALLAKRREYLYLGGFLASAVSTMLALRLASIFFGGSNAVFQIEIEVRVSVACVSAMWSLLSEFVACALPLPSALSAMLALRLASFVFGASDAIFQVEVLLRASVAAPSIRSLATPSHCFSHTLFHLLFCTAVRRPPGLLVFSGYIIYDTQVLLERARQGHCDHVVDALELLLDFVAVFVRILFILGEKQGHCDHVADALELLSGFVAVFVRILFILTRKEEREEEQRASSKRRTAASTSRR